MSSEIEEYFEVINIFKLFDIESFKIYIEKR